MQLNDDGVPLPDPELMKEWREAALRDLPTPQILAEDFADLIAALRWASELDRIGAANKELPDKLTSTEPCPEITYSAFVDPSGGVNDAMTLSVAHLSGSAICVLDAIC
jgi:hypothetical protein